MMETNDLYKFVLILTLVGMIIGVGVLTLDKFGTAVKTSSVVGAESLAISSSTGTTANDDITSIEAIYNTSTVFLDGNYSTAANQINYTASTGVIVVDGGLMADGTFSINYTYDADSAATTALSSGRDEISAVSSTWLGLIVTIAVLSIILGLVISSFAGNMQR